MASIVNVAEDTSRQLDGKPQPDEQVTEADVTDAPKLARLLTRLLAEVAKLRRPFRPRTITFTNIVSTGTDVSPYTVRLTHKFGGEVDYEVVGRTEPGVIVLPFEYQTTATDKDTLVLAIYYPATLAVRVTERG